MRYRPLGRTGCLVSELSFGTWHSTSGPRTPASLEALIHEAYDLGINLFDTADLYEGGEAEAALGRALRSFPRDSVVIATKVGGTAAAHPNGSGLSRKHLLHSLHQSLRRLQVEFIDLYQLHTFDPGTSLEETLGTLNDFVHRGLVAYLGVCNHTLEQLVFTQEVARANGWESIRSYQLRLNLLEWRRAQESLESYRAQDVGVIGYSPLAEGLLTGKYTGMRIPAHSRGTLYQDFERKWLQPRNVEFADALAPLAAELGVTRAQLAIAWCLRQPGVASTLMGATTSEQLKENVRSQELTLTEADWGRVSALLARL
jgi:aryl-alcohol dehydrogenase-like predicted oxidoreductase